MYVATGMFRSEKPTRVPRALIVGNRRLAEKVGMSYGEFVSPVTAIPDDMDSQMANVEKNPDRVLADLVDMGKKADDKEAHDERFG